MSEEMTRFDLVYVSKDGWLDTWMCGHQPTTEDIDRHRHMDDRMVIQLIGSQFMVYDLRTVRQQFHTTVIGLPKFVTEDYDAALAFAIMSASSGS